MGIEIDKQTGVITLIDDNDPSRSIKLREGESLEAASALFFGETFTPVPESVTPLQMRKALRHIGLKATVDFFIQTLDEEVVEEWEYATTIDRTNPTIAMAAKLLGLDDAQVDDLFRIASSI